MQQEPVNGIPGTIDTNKLTTKEEVDLMKAIDEHIEVKTTPMFKPLNLILTVITVVALTLAIILKLDKRDFDKCQELGVLSGQHTQWLSTYSLCVNDKGGIVERKEPIPKDKK